MEFGKWGWGGGGGGGGSQVSSILIPLVIMIMIYYVHVKEEEKMNGPCWDESIGCRENNQTYSPHYPIDSLFHPDEARQFHSP